MNKVHVDLMLGVGSLLRCKRATPAKNRGHGARRCLDDLVCSADRSVRTMRLRLLCKSTYKSLNLNRMYKVYGEQMMGYSTLLGNDNMSDRYTLNSLRKYAWIHQLMYAIPNSMKHSLYQLKTW